MNLLAASSSSLRWHALPPLWLVVLVIVPAIALAVHFFYRRESGRVGRRLRLTMGVLRALAVLLVIGALFGPYAETIEGVYFKRHLILCVDTSSSMSFHEAYQSQPELAERIRRAAGYSSGSNLATRNRLEIVRDILGRDRAYLERLANQFRLHLYTFSGETTGVFEPREEETAASAAERFTRKLPGLKADGSVTRIGTAIQDLVRAFDAKNEPVAGILLFTDGRHTGGAPYPVEQAQAAAEHTRENIPIYPVAIGDPASAINIGVSRIDAPEVALAEDEVFFTATVHARGLENTFKQLEATVLDANGEVAGTLPIDAEPFALPGDDQTIKVGFRHRFDQPGRYDLRIGVPPEPGEAVKGDNYKRHILRVVELKMRVLMIANQPNYSYRFVKEMLFRAEQTIEAHVLLLSAEPEWPQEASPGMDPILFFPQEKRELAEYDVCILMDVDLKHERMTPGGEAEREKVLGMLEDWVKRGGGLVLQAGREGNIPEEWRDPPLNALLPVIPFGRSQHRKDEITALLAEKRHHLTSAGAEHPIMRILRDPEQVRVFWDTDQYATKYYWYTPVDRAKSSASVLTVRREKDGKRPSDRPDPLVAIQDYGLGKVLWLGTDEFWRMRTHVENLYYWPFWSGSIRHLATYRLLSGNKRIKIWVDRADARYQVGDSVGIDAKFLDENFEPLAPDENDPSTMTRTLKLRAPDGQDSEITLHAAITDPPEGLFSTRIAAGQPGTYSLIAEPGPRDTEVAETTFVVEETTVEMRDPLLDMRTLRGIASKSRGRVLQPYEFRELLDEQIVPPTGIYRSGEPKRTDLWDRAWVLWLIVGLLAVEWILRRKNLLL
ncbi:MAG: VWA domain-containing protein [Planctomycetota bacterium]